MLLQLCCSVRAALGVLVGYEIYQSARTPDALTTTVHGVELRALVVPSFFVFRHFLFDRSVPYSRLKSCVPRNSSSRTSEMYKRVKEKAGPQHKHKCPNGEHLKLMEAFTKK